MDLSLTSKNLLVTISSMLLAYFAPITDMVFVIFFVFLLNFITGLISGVVVQHEHFSLKKFFHCLIETFVFYVIVLSVFVMGEKMNNLDGAIQCITGVVYAIIYFYGVNFLRNLLLLCPDSRVIKFLYHVMSLEFIRYVPFLSQYLNHKQKTDNNDEIK